MTAGHFLFIPSVLLLGVVIGWILGSRAARDAYAAELRRREERAAMPVFLHELEPSDDGRQAVLPAACRSSEVLAQPVAEEPFFQLPDHGC